MKTELAALLRRDFPSFARKGHTKLNDGDKLGDEPYIDYLCHELIGVAEGEIRRLVINLPPRHLKTFLGSICLSAWILAHRPSTKIMIVTYSEQLAADIAYKIRMFLQSAWFKAIFDTRVADDRAKVMDFATTAGGAVYAVSIEGGITGRGADLIIVDDPLDIKDAVNPEQLERVNQRFDTMIRSRLNNPKKGRIVVIAHRLDGSDLSGHVLAQGGWRHVELGLIATRNSTYDVGHSVWRRRKRELLRPDAYSPNYVEHLRKTTIVPDFETLYQQKPDGGMSLRIRPDHFPSFDGPELADRPVVLSIDPGQAGGPENSFSVIQAWCPHADGHLLLDQWREQAIYSDLRSAYWLYVRRYRPSVALIERTAQGAALISDAMRRRWVQVIPVIPDGRSKAARLYAHAKIIRSRRIQLQPDAPWGPRFVSEFTEFPSGRFDDQIDATTQYLDWIAQNPQLEKRPPRAIATVGNRYGPAPLTTQSMGLSMAQTNGAVLVKSWR